MPFKPQRGRKNFRGNFRGKDHRQYSKDKRSNTKRPEYRPQDQLNEQDVGITEFINPFDGFTGVIKARFSDFQVNEINLNGKLAKLSDRTLPKDFHTKMQEINYKEIIESPIAEIPQEKWESMKVLLQKSGETTDDETESSKTVVLDVGSLTKDDRRAVHECIKKHFGQKLVANTKNVDHQVVMEIKRYNKNDPSQVMRQRPWPQDKGEFVHFIAYKEMMDTMEVCLLIADKLCLKPSLISYAGVKDRRAKTSQWMCIKRVEPHKLLSKTNGIRNLAIGNIEFKNAPLKIGELNGNRFRIAIRNILAKDDFINKSLEFIKENGFINYYGLQRFGNDKNVPTYSIGTKLLTQQWKEAIDLILKVKSSDDPELDLTKAKKKYEETNDAKAALKLLNHRNRSLEAKLLDGLSKHKSTDYVNSLENIPRNMRLMYIHSFQSLIWNQMASKRIKEFGFKPVEGDLVLLENCSGGIDPELIIDGAGEEEIDESVPEASTFKESSPSEIELQNNQNKSEPKNRQQVKALTKADLENYSIYDIVLPLPGFDVKYPENLKHWYKKAVEEQGLTLEMTQHKVKTYNLSGAYRKLMGKPEEMSWSIMYFDDPTKNLIRSDLGELEGEEEPKNVENGKYRALVVEFNLKPASYATMVLREIMKCSTSSSMQAQQNYYAETNPKEKAPNKSKVILESSNGSTQNLEEQTVNRVSADSLLANKEKYDSFMQNILGDSVETSELECEKGAEKRKNDEAEIAQEPDNKKLKTSEESDVVENTNAN